MLYTEEAVRANLRNRDGKRVFFLGKGDCLTPGARDFLQRERIPILSGEEAKIETYRLENGGFIREKPEHMTHLHGDVLVPKTHPRIAFRGKVDTLEAQLLLCQREAEGMAKQVGEILSLARQIIRCDVLEEELKTDTLCGLTEAQQRSRSHRPQEYYGIAHFMPQSGDGREIARLNRVRCAVREAEIRCAAAFSDREGNPTRLDIIRAMNRMSSMVYILMLEKKASKGE